MVHYRLWTRFFADFNEISECVLHSTRPVVIKRKGLELQNRTVTECRGWTGPTANVRKQDYSKHVVLQTVLDFTWVIAKSHSRRCDQDPETGLWKGTTDSSYSLERELRYRMKCHRIFGLAPSPRLRTWSIVSERDISHSVSNFFRVQNDRQTICAHVVNENNKLSSRLYGNRK